MLIGTEWLIDAHECRPDALEPLETLRLLLDQVVEELGLHVVANTWHKFPPPGGVTGLLLLSESHLACHTYPEHGFATFNLHCCGPHAPWPWETRLAETLGARKVIVRSLARGLP